MRELVVKYLNKEMSRRKFVGTLTKAGITVTAAQGVLASVSSVSVAQTGPTPATGRRGAAAAAAPATAGQATTAAVRSVQGTGGSAFAEQLIASGVKYVFGNSASEDAQFYEALVDRPQLKYILTPHEGPGAAMAAGYIKASGEPAIVMQAAVVGMANAHRPDVQRVQGADAARRLLLPLRPDAAAPDATASRRSPTRSRSSSRSPSTPGWRAAPT